MTTNEEKDIEFEIALELKIQGIINLLNSKYGWFDEEALKNTSKRIAKYYREVGERENEPFNFTLFSPPKNQEKTMIINKDIITYGLCQHHMLPIEYHINIGYLPAKDGKICGLSKLGRVSSIITAKPSTQEFITEEIVEYLNKNLTPKFVICTVKGIHDCIKIRGIKQYNSEMLTSALRWENERVDEVELGNLKKEFFELIK